MALLPVLGGVSLFMDSDKGKSYDYVSSTYADEKLLYCRTRRCRIVHGSVSWLVTFVSVVAAAEKVEHEWIEYETSAAYYVAQLWKDGTATLRRFTSRSASNNEGRRCAGRNDANAWTEEYHKYSSDTSRTVQDLKDYMSQLKKGAFVYNLLTSNCKAFTKHMWGKV